jgi:hypothetical protein
MYPDIITYIKRISNNPLFVGILCILISTCIAVHLDNKKINESPTAEILITDLTLENSNSKQNLYGIGVDLSIENPSFSQRSFTIESVTLDVKVPDELRPELSNISTYYENRDYIESFAYSNGPRTIVPPGEVIKINGNEVQHTFSFPIPGDYEIRVKVDYYDSISKRPPQYAYFYVSIDEHGTIYTKNQMLPIKIS